MQDFGLSLLPGNVHIENSSQLFSQNISLFGRSRILEETSQNFSFILV